MTNEAFFAKQLARIDRHPEESVKVLEEVLSLGIEQQQHWSPRGTLHEAADPLVHADHEHQLVRRLRAFSGEALHYLLATLGTWGGPESAKAIYELYVAELDSADDDATRGQCLQSLGRLGGSHSVTGLVRAIICESDEIAEGAAWQLRELGTGGSFDELNAQTVVGTDFMHQVVAACQWKMLSPDTWKDRRAWKDHREGVARLYKWLRTYSGDSEPVAGESQIREWFRASFWNSNFLRQAMEIKSRLQEESEPSYRSRLAWEPQILGETRRVIGSRSVAGQHRHWELKVIMTHTGGTLLLSLIQPMPLELPSLWREFASISNVFNVKTLRNILVSFSGVSSVDSQLIGELLQVRSLVTKPQGRIILCQLPVTVYEQLSLLHMNLLFEISPTYEQAVEELGGTTD